MDLSTEGMLIIRTLAYALRHNPTQFNLALDAEGWASIEQLVNELRFARYDWALLDWTRIERTIRGSDRFEVCNGRIRADYGHSIKLAKPPAIATPPAVLYHGTSTDNVSNILQQGVLRMRRRFAHLSSDYEWVVRFLDDKPAWTIFAIDTSPALEAGILFRKANHHVWLTDALPANYLRIKSTGEGMRLSTVFAS